jgi:hypothetical protein
MPWTIPGSARRRRPSRLGLTLTFCLLFGLLIWRWAIPSASLWLDAALLAAAGVILLIVRARVEKPRDPNSGG